MTQIEKFKKGFQFSRLKKPCIIDDGVVALTKEDVEKLGQDYNDAICSRRVMKFVPASGAASRMFKTLLTIHKANVRISEKELKDKIEAGSLDYKAFSQFIQGLKKFAFYDDLKSTMLKDGHDIDALISKGKYGKIVDYILTSKGLNLANLPKGLIAFHQYDTISRTSFEEHLIEAKSYAKGSDGMTHIHFTISIEHEDVIKEHVARAVKIYEKPDLRFNVTFSTQSQSTDTIAVDMDDNPFRDNDGQLLFRPGGHGALIDNLNNLKCDIVFIKNIDNIVPDRLKQETILYKKALGGYLLKLQNKIFYYLERLSKKEIDNQVIQEIFEFTQLRLSIIPPREIEQGKIEDKIAFLFAKLNCPLRVCGMVKNEGEPGGGPFWVKQKDGCITPQIVESSQVEMSDPDQNKIWQSSTHFNPVDLVCGLHDFKGRPFNLEDYVDPETIFISKKSKEGRDLKALELPGLWNGAMAFWNTVFVEVPLITFNPVKTILDLLRKEHQPEK